MVQIISFGNSSDHAFVQQTEGNATSVGVTLPAGASYEDFSGGSYLVSADGTQVLDTQPVLPGDSHVMHVAYTLPYSGSASISQPLDYALNGQVEVLAATGGMSVSGDGVTLLGTRQLGTSIFNSFGGSFTKSAGDSLSYSISGADGSQAATTAAAPASGISVIAYVLIGAGLLAIGAAFGFFMRERTNNTRTPAPNLSPNELMKEIADLDVRYSEGSVPEAAYQKQRSALKAQLVLLMKDKANSSAD